MQSVLDFLRARLATPTLRFHAVMTVVMALVMTGLVSTEQITGFIGTLTALATVVGPSLALLSKAPEGLSADNVAAVIAEVAINHPEAVKVRSALENLAGALDVEPEVHVDVEVVKAAMDRLGVRRTG